MVVIGLDGVPFEFLNRYEDAVPNIQAIREEGIEAPLESTFPPWTPSAWPSIYTGRYPHEHGVYGFFTYPDHDPSARRVVSRTEVNAPSIWDYAGELGLSSVVLNVPVTHPATPMDGTLIPGYLSPEDADSYPKGIRDRLREAGIEYRIYAAEETGPSTDQKLDSYVELIRTRKQAVQSLLADEEWDFAFVELQKTDAVFHNFEQEPAFRRIYQAMDEFVGAVLELTEEGDDVLLVSDHGMTEVTGRTVYVNEALREAGLLTSTTQTDGPDFKEALVRGGDTNRSDPIPTVAFRRALSGLASFGVTRRRLASAAERLGIESRLRRHLPSAVRDSLSQRPDYAVSEAFCRLGSEMGVRVNLTGREPDGVVPPEEYEQVREAIIKSLKQLKDSDGRPIFEFVRRYESLVGVEPTGDAPDVVFLPAAMNHTVSHKMPGVVSVPVRAYDHSQTGVFIGKGPSFETAPESVEAVSVAPVVLGVLSGYVPSGLFDRLPVSLLAEEVREREFDIRQEVDDSQTEEGTSVEEHLEDLGYL
jgi:predicted AlkP superfamily phosphohydrolase/phosphomutase